MFLSQNQKSNARAISIPLLPPAQTDVAGGRKYNPGQVYQVERIVSEHTKFGGDRRFGIKWLGWDATYNTIEPADSVLDKSLIEDWDASRRAEVDLQEAIALQRSMFASELLKLKEPTWGFEVPTPACALSGVAHPLLTRDAARYGVELEVIDEAARRWTSIELNSMEQIRAGPWPPDFGSCGMATEGTKDDPHLMLLTGDGAGLTADDSGVRIAVVAGSVPLSQAGG